MTVPIVTLGTSLLLLFIIAVFNYPIVVFAQEEETGEDGVGEEQEMADEGISLMTITEWVGMGALGMVGGMAIITSLRKNIKNSAGASGDDSFKNRIRRIGISVAVAILSLSAGIIHLLLVQEHLEESYAWGVFFIFMGVFQIVYGSAILLIAGRAGTILFYTGVAGNMAFIGVFIYARLLTPPFAPEAGPIQELELNGVMTLILQALIVALLAYSLKSNREIKKVVQ